MEALPYLDNSEVIYVAGDMDDECILEEEEAMAILANYGQVRKYLHNKALNRGYFKSTPPGSKGSSGKRPFKAITNGPNKSHPPPKPKFPRHNARPKMWQKSNIMARTKCARCGKVGHWARSCTNPPDERGKKRAQMLASGSSTAFVYTSDDSKPTFVLWWYLIAGEFSLLGFVMIAGFGLIDTGAQHGVIGMFDFEEFCKALARFGLKPRVIPTLELTAVGVGGSTRFVKSVEVPTGLQGICGTLTLNVVECSMPLLIPSGFCRALGMILDTTDDTATWTKLGGKVSKVHILPSEHMAINLLEFPTGGWVNPYDNKKNLRVGGGESKPYVS
ncbi:MAG: C2HC-type zinc finger protein, partial [Pseudomonadota bacterium]|nr:C2HC-type zinc finger protein [Pseudomonadota bacterium]